MGNACTCIRPSKEVSSSPAGGSTMGEATERGGGTSIADQIENSKSHWSERVESHCSNEEEVADNMEVFRTLQSHPQWGLFFITFGYDTEERRSSGELSVGEKFAEGGQAELFHAHVTWTNPKHNEYIREQGEEWVVKVFKKGTLLRHLQSQWPEGFLQWWAETLERSNLGKPRGIRYQSDVMYGTLLKDGRFAFLMLREHEDLRSLIDRIMLSIGEECGPFSKEQAELIMYRVAKGMDWLHSRNIVHRDLKASNVLFRHYEHGWDCFVADFECSIGVVGTGFWRAPEILQALKDRVLSQSPEVFSEKSDVYSYGMTCYEILTGKLPFKGHLENKYDLILKEGRQPEVPEHVDGWAQELLSRCWQKDPAARPSFGEIMNFLSANSAAVRKYQVVEQEDEERRMREYEERLLARDPVVEPQL